MNARLASPRGEPLRGTGGAPFSPSGEGIDLPAAGTEPRGDGRGSGTGCAGAQRWRRSLTDEPIDALVMRPLAAHLVDWLLPTRVTPNEVSAASAAANLLAAAALASGRGALAAGAGALMLVAMVLDAADGQLARARGGGSPHGRLWDGIADYTGGIALYVGLLVGLSRGDLAVWGRPLAGAPAAALVVAAGVSEALHAMRFDALKQRHLAARGGRAIETAADVERRAAEARGAAAWALRVYTWYVRAQGAPGEGELERRLAVWGLTGTSGHRAAMAAAALSAPLWPEALGAYCLFALLGMNAFLLAGLAREAWLERRGSAAGS